MTEIIALTHVHFPKNMQDVYYYLRCYMYTHKKTLYSPSEFWQNFSYSILARPLDVLYRKVHQVKGYIICYCLLLGFVLKIKSLKYLILQFFLIFLGETYDLLIIYFEVERSFRHYLFKAYIPTVMLVLFNLMSYWIPDTAVSARISLIITTFLSCVLIFMSVTDDIVKVSYLTAMQVFMLGSLMFIMIAIVQFLLLIHLRTRKSQVSSYSCSCVFELMIAKSYIQSYSSIH